MYVKETLFKGKINFLKTNFFTTVTCQVTQDMGEADEKNYNRIIVPGGTPYPANDATCEGILFEDVEVTYGDNVGALMIRGDIIKSALPVELSDDAQTALEGLGFRFFESDDSTEEETE